MNMMNKVFMEFLDKFVIAFIDDILIYSKSNKEHEKHCRNLASADPSYDILGFRVMRTDAHW